jgi:hypothetical protein
MHFEAECWAVLGPLAAGDADDDQALSCDGAVAGLGRMPRRVAESLGHLRRPATAAELAGAGVAVHRLVVAIRTAAMLRPIRSSDS